LSVHIYLQELVMKTAATAAGTTNALGIDSNAFAGLLETVKQQYSIKPKPALTPTDEALLRVCKKVTDANLLTVSKNIITTSSIYNAKAALESVQPGTTDLISQWVNKFGNRMVIEEQASKQRFENGETSHFEQISLDEDTAFRIYKHSNGSCSIIVLDKNRVRDNEPRQPVMQPSYNIDDIFTL
jgi:hypothetical protein